MITQLPLSFSPSSPFLLACSGGVDSMAIADFYHRGNKQFSIAYFNHATSQADQTESFLRSYSAKRNIPFLTSKLVFDKPKSESLEEYWRKARYSWLRSFSKPIVTAHHLNDVMETWIFSSFNGNPKIICQENEGVFRPFLLNSKEELKSWCIRHEVPWVEDQSNNDVHFPRNRIRHNILPEALMVNPGLGKVLRKKILEINKNATVVQW